MFCLFDFWFVCLFGAFGLFPLYLSVGLLNGSFLWLLILKVKVWKWKSLSHVWLVATPWTNTIRGILQTRILEWIAFPFWAGIFPTQGLNPGLLHCRQIFYRLSHSSVQFSHSVMSDSLRPHEPQHTRPPCPSPTLRVHPNSRLLSRWCHPTISSSVTSSSCPQSFPASGSFSVSQLFTSGGQSTGASVSPSVLPVNFRVDFF